MGSKSAHADVADLSCVGEETSTYSPGLTFNSQKTSLTVNGQLKTCEFLSDPEITSGSFGFEATGMYSCLLDSLGPYELTYNLKNGQSITVDYEKTVITKPAGQNVQTSTGTVTSGKFIGDIAVTTVTLATLDSTKCLTTGVTSATGAVTLTLIKKP